MASRGAFGEYEDENPSAAPLDGDAVEHLWNAAHEMLRAMRTLLDAADEFVESQRIRPPSGRGDARVHHIDIDADADDPDRVFRRDAAPGTS